MIVNAILVLLVIVAVLVSFRLGVWYPYGRLRADTRGDVHGELPCGHDLRSLVVAPPVGPMEHRRAWCDECWELKIGKNLRGGIKDGMDHRSDAIPYLKGEAVLPIERGPDGRLRMKPRASLN